MNKYQNELFQFFMSDDNFSVTCDVVEHFGTMKKELIQQFWNAVTEKLKQKMIDHPGWKIYADNDCFINNARICAYKDQFCTERDVADISISISNLHAGSYYGIWMHMKRNDERFKNIRLVLPDLRQGFRSDGIESWWPIWQQTRIDFNNMEDLRRLHHSQRNEMIESVVNSFMEFFNFMKQKLEQLLPEEVAA